MSLLPSAFKVADHGEMNDFPVYPIGKYNMKIVEASMELTKKAKEANNPKLGQFLKLKFKILDGKFKDKFFFRQLNLVNPNALAQELGNNELATLGKAIGKNVIEKTEDLLGDSVPPMVVILKQKGKESDQYGVQNDVKKYEKYSGSAPASSPAGAVGTSGSASSEGEVKSTKKW